MDAISYIDISYVDISYLNLSFKAVFLLFSQNYHKYVILRFSVFFYILSHLRCSFITTYYNSNMFSTMNFEEVQ